MSLFNGGVQFEQSFAAFHRRARLKSDLSNGASFLGAEHDALCSGDGSHCAQDRLPSVQPDLGGGDGCRRRSKTGSRRKHGLELKYLGAGQRPNQQQQTGKGKENFFDHGKEAQNLMERLIIWG